VVSLRASAAKTPAPVLRLKTASQPFLECHFDSLHRTVRLRSF
jgi:hypothetical protein